MLVTRFDAAPDGNATLVARWSVLDPDENEVVSLKRSIFEVTTPTTGFEGVAAALSQALAELSREIATAIQNAK